MKQQINLYLPEFRKQPDIFSVAVMGRGLAVLAVVLVLLTAVDYWNTRQLDSRLAVLLAERDAALMRVNSLLEEFGVQGTDPALVQRVQTLESELVEKRRLLQFLEGRDLGNTRGFSVHLSDLSRYHITGLRLTEISLTRGGEAVRLQGQVLRGDLVPLYLQNLSQGQAFRGRTFETLQLESSPANAGLLQFSVVSNSP